MSTADVKNNAQTRMNKSIETLRADLAKVRTGRAHTGILDHVMVDYYGNPTPINQVANLTLVDARTIGVTPFEKKMTGVTISTCASEDTMPPSTGVASGFITSAPTLVLHMIGSRPATTVATVITLGRSRRRAPSITASRRAARVSVPPSAARLRSTASSR